MSQQGSYRPDRLWSDAHIGQVKAIVGPYLLEQAPAEWDMKRATDLIILQNKSVQIACRLRRPGYENFSGEFTIRSHRANGIKTELAKIIDGWGDWFFYGHVLNEKLIRPWYLLDLHVFRATLIRDPSSVRLKKLDNEDGTFFFAYRIDSFPPELVIASERALVTA